MTYSDIDVPIITKPFAYADTNREYCIVDNSDFYKLIPTIAGGITSPYCVPYSNGGTRFTRHMMNGIGYLSTIGSYLLEMGYPMGNFSTTIADYLEGYPQGAIVTYITDDGYVIDYESKIDNNMQPLPPMEGGIPIEDDNWRPITTTTRFVGVPDIQNGIIAEAHADPAVVTDQKLRLEIEFDTAGYAVFSKTMPSYNDLPMLAMIYGYPTFEVKHIYPRPGLVPLYPTIGTIPFFGAATTTCSLPVCAGKYWIECNNYNEEVYGEVSCDIMVYPLEARK